MTNDFEPDVSEDSDAIASKEDLLITRDGDGELNPVKQDLPGTDKKVEVIPLTTGDLNTFDTIDTQEPDDDELARLFNQHLTMFDEGELSAEDISERVPAMKIQAFVNAIMKASGQDMQSAVNQDQLEMLEGLDEGKMETLLMLAEKQDDIGSE